MNVEKTIEFLLSNQAKHDERFARLESVVERLADNVVHLDGVMTTLAEAQIKLVGRMDNLTTHMDSIAQQSAQWDRQLGQRIDGLVVAIGEFIRNRPAAG